MVYSEKEFYQELLRLIDEDLKTKELKPIDLLKGDYEISRTQYYNIKKISEGDKTISRLSHSRLIDLCDYLQIDLNDVLYDVSSR